MVKRNGRRIAVIGLAVLLAGSLLAVGAVRVMRGRTGATAPRVVDKAIAAETLPLGSAPLLVQEMAHRLATSRVGFTISVDRDVYLVISTGDAGEKIGLDRLRLRSGIIDVLLRQEAGGSRLLVVRAAEAEIGHRMFRYNLDGNAIIPTVVNPDNVPPVALPVRNNLVAVEPRPGARVVGNSLLVTGFARLGVDEQFRITVTAAGSGVVLASKPGLGAAALTPDWGSFAVTLPLQVPPGTGGEAAVVIAIDKTGEVVTVPIRLGR